MLKSFILSGRTRLFVTLSPSHIQSQHFSFSISLHISAIHYLSPFTQHSSSPFTQLQCFTTRHPLLFKILLQHQLSFFLHTSTHPLLHNILPHLTSSNILPHLQTSSYTLHHSKKHSQHLLLQPAQLKYFGIKSASIFNLSNIICSLSETFTLIINHVFIWKS